MAKRRFEPSETIEAPPATCVGDWVHYIAKGDSLDFATGTHRAALVTAVREDGAVTLWVVPPGSQARYNVAGVQMGQSPGMWHPIERD